ncbi:hypothetical protein BKA70DRAFT_1264689 [Coprinopsis sp. MPI-PUGE-AT-0042]|nr:hypothetical protein BKA70DRAFT_1264689 [Coprinopsis sp. MPI-PUGE-AT-0042]
MPQNYTLLVDDQDSQINYICPSLKQQLLSGAFLNSTWTTIKDSSCENGWFEYNFYGTGIHFRIPTSQPAESAALLLDNVLLEPQGDGSFESQGLPDGKHTFTYGIGEVSSMPVFDYLTVTAGPSTPLSGRTLIVDDADASVSYSGNWVTAPPQPLAFDYSTSLHRDTAHWSSTVGDTVSIQFTGSSVAVYGIARNITSGNIGLSYTIDGATTTKGVPEGALDTLPMTRFFQSDLQPGAHTLIINVTEIAAQQAFGIDFITYNSSVANLSSLPGSGIAAGNAGSPQDEARSGRGAASARNAILGGVLGAVGFLLAMGLVLLVWKRRQQKHAVRLASNNNSYDDVAGTAQQPPMTQT